MTEHSEQTAAEAAEPNGARSDGPGLEGVDFAPGRAPGQGKHAARDAAGGQAESAGATSAPDPKNELEEARREIEELKDNWTRERAEFTNFRKRQIVERQKARAHTVAEFVQKLLPAIDNLDRVLSVKTEDPAVKNFVVGVDMIRQELLQVLERERITPVLPAGLAFDPFAMEAIAMEDRADIEQDIVLEVFQAGYVMAWDENERHVLRPARVKVGKPAKVPAADGT